MRLFISALPAWMVSTYASLEEASRLTILCLAFTLCPSALGTYCAPTPLLTALSDVEVFYHLYAAGQKLSRQDLWVLHRF